jgi:hypothetical protein
VPAQATPTSTSMAKSHGLCGHGLVWSRRSRWRVFVYRCHSSESRELESDLPSGPTFATELCVPTRCEIDLASHRGPRPGEDTLSGLSKASEDHPEPAAAVVMRRG